MRRAAPAMREFIASEAAGGIVLMAASALALAVANSPLAPAYFEVLDVKAGPLSLHHWINDGLMAVFFLVVGLEIRSEFAGGALASWSQRRLPVIAAAAGMAAPAFVYLAVAPGLARGWAIPAATDIAFACGVLAILGRRAPAQLKTLLTTIAVVDDLGAVAIIALVYTATLSLPALAVAAAIMAAMRGLDALKVRALWLHLLLAAALWLAVAHSGVHATVAGVLAAMLIPKAHVHRLESALNPWVAFGVVPLFGFANAGVTLGGADPFAPLPLGIVLGLVLGKQLGIFGSIWIAVKAGIAARPAPWIQLWGMALLAGIGFTMSLFIGGLAFPHQPELADSVKIGVLAGSLLSAIAGYAVLRTARASE
ncbi:Na+/H+ antiporter NhaA [Sphingomonas sp. LB-2]|uniref:Na+/H+ antiporter NhaA n=1 Tax=Sphingomonas caeni TaxID=2984949 RepID=UPI0022307A30|nr:Na+/H+ antiporter NhaA [Sphingomonas caeni]MCW3846842.1 Na+/H+ antiporter NhaA [Sphingomonas caeni]